MPYQPPERNYEGIQHAELRQHSDPVATEFHDAVSAAYYDDTDLVLAGHNFGRLSEAEFQRLHHLAHALQQAAMHYANLQTRQGGSLLVNENAYRYRTQPDAETGGEAGQIDVIAKAQETLRNVLADYPELGAYELTIPNPRNPNQSKTASFDDLATYDLNS